MPHLALIQEPRSYSGTTERLHTSEIDAAVLESIQHVAGVIIAAYADTAGRNIPEARAKGGVENRAARLPHPTRTIGKDHVVHEQIAEDHHVGRHVNLYELWAPR
jgi:hypothetical protein